MRATENGGEEGLRTNLGRVIRERERTVNEEMSPYKGQVLSRYGLLLAAASILPVVITLLLLALPGVAHAKKHHKVDFAKGTNVMQAEGPLINFYAQSLDEKPNTPAAKGHFSATGGDNGEFFLKGKITCLRVSGKGSTGVAAYFVGKVEQSNVSDIPVGQLVGVDVFDSGKPNGEGDLLRGGPTDSKECRAPTGEGDPITQGNIVVKNEGKR
jgi:hypothetical protein